MTQGSGTNPLSGGSGAAGSTNFNVTDRVALTQLIHAYAIEVDRGTQVHLHGTLHRLLRAVRQPPQPSAWHFRPTPSTKG